MVDRSAGRLSLGFCGGEYLDPPLYGGIVYGFVLGSAVAVLWMPYSLKRPIAFLAVTTLLVLDTLLFSLPDALGWFVPILALKLLVGHLVPERGIDH